MVQLVEEFITAFFDQNPLSNIGIIVTRESKAEKLTELVKGTLTEERHGGQSRRVFVVGDHWPWRVWKVSLCSQS